MQPNHFRRLTQGLAPHATAFCAAFGALAGAGGYFGLPFEPLPWVGAGLALVAVVLALAARTRPVWVAAVFATFTAAAFVMAQWQVVRTTPVDYAAGSKPHWLAGTVEEIYPKPDNPKRAVLRMRDVELYGLGANHVAKASVGVHVKQLAGVAVGDDVAVQAVLLPPEPPKYDGQRDSRIWRYFETARVAGYAVGSVEPTERNRAEGFGNEVLPQIGQSLKVMRNAINQQTKEMAEGAVTALLTGEERWVAPEVRDAYRNTGLSHLLAISGMQLTLVGLGIFGLLVWLLAWVPNLALRVNIRAVAAVGAMAGVVFYTFLAGASVSLVRATVMNLLVLLAIVGGRMNSGLRAWCVAVVLIILFNPAMVLRAGFQLSAVAVLGLLLLVQFGPQKHKPHGLWWLKELVLATLVAGAVTAPVVVAHFGQFNVVGLLGNLVAVPLMTVATYLGMVALAVWPLGLEHWPLWAMARVVQGVNEWAMLLNGWQLASVAVPKGLWGVLVPFAGAVLASVLAGRWGMMAGSVAAMMLVGVGLAHAVKTPDVLVWDGGKVGLVRVDGAYAVLWARDGMEDVTWLARGAGVTLRRDVEPSRSVDERFMPVSSLEDFAWAAKTAGQWHVEPVACGRPWQALAAACWK